MCFSSYGWGAFFYSVPAIPPITPQQYYQSPFLINHGYQQLTPASFFLRQFTPATTFYSTHQSLGSTEFGPTVKPEINTYTSGINKLSNACNFLILCFFLDNAVPTVDVRTQFATSPTNQYRGFAYRTTYDNGASANVIFVTGPEAQELQKQGIVPQLNVSSFSARTIASDATDSNAIQNNNINNVPNFNFQSFFRNPIGVQNFYSRSGRVLNDNKYPASTVPLNNPIPIAEFNDAFFKSTESSNKNSTSNESISNDTETATLETTTVKEAETAESMVTTVRVKSQEVNKNTISSEIPLKSEELNVTESVTVPTAVSESDKTTQLINENNSIEKNTTINGTEITSATSN